MTSSCNVFRPEALLQTFSQALAQSTGLPLQFHKAGEFCVAEDPQIPEFCRVMAHGHKACQQCVATHLKLQDPSGTEIRTSNCFAGLTSSAIPVVRDQELVGYLHTGHAYVDRPQGCRKPGRGCVLPGRSEAGCGCAGACSRTPRLKGEQYQGAIGLIRLFADHFASVHPCELQGSPYPAIDYAIQLLRNDVSRRWALTDLAKQAGMHPSYFSEKFHERTGETLTAFLAAIRVGKARQLLAYTALPISEIAFASGFRSLSQFNRVYKKQTGHPPGEDRR